MNKLNKNVEYALIALNHMKGFSDDHLISVKSLAVYMNAPFDPLSRVLQKLSKHNIVSSTQGVNGGYRLTCSFKKISLYDLIKIIQGPVEIVKCLSDDLSCAMESNCGVKSPVTFLNKKIIEFYKAITIEELLLGNSKSLDHNNLEALA